MSNNSGCSVDLLDVLTIVFVVLKLTGNITWSWWWVLAPTWIPAAIILIAVFIVFVLDEWF